MEGVITMEDKTYKEPQQNLWYGDRKKDRMSIQEWIESVQNAKGKTGHS